MADVSMWAPMLARQKKSTLCHRIMGCLSGLTDRNKDGRKVEHEGRRPDILVGLSTTLSTSGLVWFCCLGENTFW